MNCQACRSLDKHNNAWTSPLPEHFHIELLNSNKFWSILEGLDICPRIYLPWTAEPEQSKTTWTSFTEYISSEMPYSNDYTTRRRSVLEELDVNISTNYIVKPDYHWSDPTASFHLRRPEPLTWFGHQHLNNLHRKPGRWIWWVLDKNRQA